jgi:hypothetical protein
MITQSNHNTIIERVKILTQLRELDKTPQILSNVTDFLYKIKSFDEYESMSMPSHILSDTYDNLIIFEWNKRVPPSGEDVLIITFAGDEKVRIQASYPSMDIKVDNCFDLNEDMANFVTTHLDNFKQPLKKKRYK